ncbi:MAG: LUD domain-containing protein [Ilumatobacteraceae bacterium]
MSTDVQPSEVFPPPPGVTPVDDALIASFAERAQALGAAVDEVDDLAGALDVIRRVAGDSSIVVAPELERRFPGFAAAAGGVALDDAHGRAVVEAAANAGVGVAYASMAIAETGSVVIGEPTLADRVVTMLTADVVVIVERDAFRRDLDAVAEELHDHAAPSYVALHSGPSRTADIERSLTIGVQGAVALRLVVVR